MDFSFNQQYYVLIFFLLLLTSCGNELKDNELNLEGTIDHANGMEINLLALSYTSSEIVATTSIDNEGKFSFRLKLHEPGVYSLKIDQVGFWLLLLENVETEVHLDTSNSKYSHVEVSTENGKSFSKCLGFIEQTLTYQDSIYASFEENGNMHDGTQSFTDSVDVLINKRILNRIEEESNPIIIAYLLKWTDSALNYDFIGSQIERLNQIAPHSKYTKEWLRKYDHITNAVLQEKLFEENAMTIDSSIYNYEFDTVKIGNQVWMAENLNIPTPNSWCLYDEPLNCDKYGSVYNWFDAQLACPPGWHVPSDEEWMELEQFLGMKAEEAHKETWRGENVGGKLKTNDVSWDQPNNGATNSSGFSAIPCGPRNKFGMYGLFGHNAIYWTSSSYGESHAIYRYLGNSRNDVGRSNTSKFTGFYVRLIKD